ncbi:hypothetical protein ACIBTZ_13185 [Micromonospora sp. NPDC049460]|uniref:methylation-associated defense system protein MAD7 n=1 Tax=Micromonospora sp. NPDC049460 TaxID=3364272 RepID=UPI00378973DB
MGLKQQDTDFRYPGISYIDYKLLDMDRVLTAFLMRLNHGGAPSRVSRSADLTVDHYAEEMSKKEENRHLFEGFDEETTRRWVESHLIDMVNRGKPTQKIAGLRPLYGYTYRLRNARHSRSYGADEHLYELLRHASAGRDGDTLRLLREFFFPDLNGALGPLTATADVDVETQALISLVEAVKNQVTDTRDNRARMSYPPLLPDAAKLLADDVVRLLYHRRYIPRSVMIDYLKILFAFHMGLYHLRLLKTLPALTAGQIPETQHGFFLDVGGTPNSPSAKLAERSAQTWYARIPDFVRSTYLVKKLDDFARHLHRRGKRVSGAEGPVPVTDLLRLLGPSWTKDRDAFGTFKLTALLESTAADDREREIREIIDLGLDDFTTYVEIVTAYKVNFHRKYLTECLDALLLKNRSGAMIAQPRRGRRRFVLDGRLLEVLLQIALLTPAPGGGLHTAELRVDEFLAILRDRYGLYVDRLPPGDGFDRAAITDHTALRANLNAFVSRLREIGFYSDLSDAYLSQTITPRYVVSTDGTTR